MYLSLFILSHFDGHLDCFQSVAITMKTAMNICAQVSVETQVFFSPGLMPRSGIVGLQIWYPSHSAVKKHVRVHSVCKGTNQDLAVRSRTPDPGFLTTILCCYLFIYIYLFTYLFIAALRSMQHLSSPTRDRTRAPCSGNTES